MGPARRPTAPAGQKIPEVEGEDGVDRRVFEDAVLDHRRRAGGHLLGGLEDELDVTRQGVAAAGEHLGRG